MYKWSLVSMWSRVIPAVSWRSADRLIMHLETSLKDRKANSTCRENWPPTYDLIVWEMKIGQYKNMRNNDSHARDFVKRVYTCRVGLSWCTVRRILNSWILAVWISHLRVFIYGSGSCSLFGWLLADRVPAPLCEILCQIYHRSYERRRVNLPRYWLYTQDLVLKCLSGVWGFYIFEIFGCSWEKL